MTGSGPHPESTPRGGVSQSPASRLSHRTGYTQAPTDDARPLRGSWASVRVFVETLPGLSKNLSKTGLSKHLSKLR